MTTSAASWGRLPDPGPARVAGIELPPGAHVRPRPRSEPDGEPYAWITTETVPDSVLYDLWRRLVARSTETGLWPVAATGLGGDAVRPWLDPGLGEREDPTRYDAAAVLTRHTDHGGFDDELPTDPRFVFTRLAAAVPGRNRPPLQLPAGVGVASSALMLVPVLRPADVPARLGWRAANHDLGGGEASAVLRSWEDRFGAVVVGIGLDSLVLQAGRAPTDPSELDRLVAEHHAFCSDTINQGAPAEEYRDEVAAQQPDRGVWAFWWD